MKLKTILLFLVLIIFVGCQKESFASIHLKVNFEDPTNKELPRIYWISIFKDEKLFKRYGRFEKPYIEKEIVIDSLSNGNYKFVYENFLNQQMQKTIEISESKIYAISIHPDYSKYTDFINESFVKNLKENEKVEFSFESLGCFHSAENKVEILRKEEKYYFITRGITKKLSAEELDVIIKMECELNLLQRGGCTTKDHYTIKFENKKKEYFDRTCAWHGWENMFKQINLKEK
ncbi:hypothetical protein ACFSJW_23195 [Flavobacterium artemisiae]|uniref:Lipoprotein n=1 Tax=Flavobacterium artemisiae TaxID=2126556 RepID=A0ABW4H843_9FLAO